MAVDRSAAVKYQYIQRYIHFLLGHQTILVQGREDPSMLPASRRHIRFLFWLDIFVRALFFYGLYYLFSKIFL